MTLPHTGIRRTFANPRLRKRPIITVDPKGDMNVTPFIDVLLVLLVMLILAIPIKTHVTEIEVPTQSCRECTVRDINTVVIDEADQLFWNGTPVTSEQLGMQVALASETVPDAELRFNPAALASYDRSARTIALIKESGAKGFAFVGNARHKDFGS